MKFQHVCSLRRLRNEGESRASAVELVKLRTAVLAPQRTFNLWYFNEAGFTLQPLIHYAWQKVGQTLELASTRDPRQNVLSFLNLHKEFYSFAFQGTIDTHTVIHCFDLFCDQLERSALVTIDNAPIHTSDDCEEEVERWQKRGLYLKFLPPYCPELNLIENL